MKENLIVFHQPSVNPTTGEKFTPKHIEVNGSTYDSYINHMRETRKHILGGIRYEPESTEPFEVNVGNKVIARYATLGQAILLVSEMGDISYETCAQYFSDYNALMEFKFVCPNFSDFIPLHVAYSVADSMYLRSWSKEIKEFVKLTDAMRENDLRLARFIREIVDIAVKNEFRNFHDLLESPLTDEDEEMYQYMVEHVGC